MVRAAAIEGLAQLQVTEANDSLRDFLDDKDPRVRLAAVSATGRLQIQSARDSLLKIAQGAEADLRRASLDTLRLLKEPRAVPLAVAALKDRDTQVAALRCLGELGGPSQMKAVLELGLRDPSAEVLPPIVHLLTTWADGLPRAEQQAFDNAIAELQGGSGALQRWKIKGPLSTAAASALISQVASPSQIAAGSDGAMQDWQIIFAAGADSRVSMAPGKSGDTVWLAFTDFHASEPAAVQFLASSRGKFAIWLNGQIVLQRDQTNAFALDADRFEEVLRQGANRLLVQVNSTEGAEFQARFRRKSTTAEHEQLTQSALSRSGSVERGRKLFFDIEKSQCLKCHRMAGQGEPIGPELTGIGNRFSRIHIIESILEPNRTIAPSYQTVEFILKDGRELSGVLIAAQNGMFTLADNQGRRQEFARSDLSEQRTRSVSVMPEGLENGLTTEEFIDLVAFLVSQKTAKR
jgi:putative heme-binding domain-containing protein